MKKSPLTLIPFKKLASSKAWKLTSELVRKQSKGICYTCGKFFPFEKLSAGHFIEKIGNAAIYFDLNGLRAQCYRCNRKLHGAKDIYVLKLLKEIVQEGIEMLRRKAGRTHIWTVAELSQIESDRKKDLADLENEKG